VRRRRSKAAAYVLGALAPEDEARARARERDDPAFAAEVVRLRAVATRLDGLGESAWDMPDPPPLAHRAAAATRRRSRVLTLRPMQAALAATVLLIAGATGGVLVNGGDEDTATPVARVVLARLGDAPAAARAEAVIAQDGTRTMTLDVSGLPPTRPGDFYEVWMLRSPAELVSVGTFRVDRGGRARVTFPVGADARRFPVVDVSREPADGDPRHSSDSVLRSAPIRS
jgi:anti-sigma-K factor RskA